MLVVTVPGIFVFAVRMPTLRVFAVRFVTMIMVVIVMDRVAGDLITNEQQKRFEEVPDASSRSFARRDAFRQTAEDQDHDQEHDDFDNHEAGNADSRFPLVHVPQFAKRLRNQDLTAERQGGQGKGRQDRQYRVRR